MSRNSLNKNLFSKPMKISLFTSSGNVYNRARSYRRAASLGIQFETHICSTFHKKEKYISK